jgi:GT2 family glycosyltransferase
VTSIAVVTCWKDHLELADDYFEALLPELEEGDESIIIDNGSKSHLPFAHIFPGSNLGFVDGNNLGLDNATADAVLFLNNDISLGRRGWLEEIRQALEPGVLLGPLRTHHLSMVDGVQVPYIDGWCLTGMRADLLDLGGFDTYLEEPAYYSDNLLCLEARARGMTLREIRVGLTHLENVTAGPYTEDSVRRASSANRERYLSRARELLDPVSN